jgi:hypothetical protein
MPRLQSRSQREATFLELAKRMYGELEKWYDDHLQASFGEIESEARDRRRDLMGELLALLINGRDLGYQLQPPTCRECGRAMEFEHYRVWLVKGLEGDTELQRAYYVCPQCKGQTLFPPQPETPFTRGSLE